MFLALKIHCMTIMHPSISLPSSAGKPCCRSHKLSNSSGVRAGKRDKLRGTPALDARTSAEECVQRLVLSGPGVNEWKKEHRRQGGVERGGEGG